MRSVYESHVQPYLSKIAEWANNGATHAEIAKNLHIGVSSLRKYLQLGREGDERYAELAECYARACEEPDDNVEAALYKLACGYTVSLAKTFKIKRAEFDPVTGRKIGEYEELVIGHDETHVPANVEAQKFWLANRRRDKWQYKPDSSGQSEDGFHGVIELPPVMDKPEGGDQE